tara:strand:- start:2527 stop:2859 length:333 start_codon:yes stop_codon:yes gene_type:complete
MDVNNLKHMKGGWLIGNFEPSVFKADFEVGIHKHKKGEFHQDHFHKIGTEINCVLEGIVKINGKQFLQDDIFILYPYEISQVEYITDCKILVARSHSIPSDKYICEVNSV